MKLTPRGRVEGWGREGSEHLINPIAPAERAGWTDAIEVLVEKV